jgi:long-chain acyl-CoA synthetase
MENKFKESPVIEQIIVVGENKNFPAALVVPSIQGLKDWCRHKDIPYTTDVEMLKKAEILDKFQKEIDEKNKYFGKWEQIKKFVVLPQQWTVETGELTPTMKLKRKIIHQKFSKEIESMYQ